MTNRLAIASMVLVLAVAGAGGCATRDAARHPAPGSPADPGAAPAMDSASARWADGDDELHDPASHPHQHPSPSATEDPLGGHEHHDHGGSHAH